MLDVVLDIVLDDELDIEIDVVPDVAGCVEAGMVVVGHAVVIIFVSVGTAAVFCYNKVSSVITVDDPQDSIS